MIKKTKFAFVIYISFAVLVLLVTAAIIIYSPYYSGFEGGLYYLSPDLSENRSVIRDSVTLNGKSVVKLVFEKKDSFGNYDIYQFRSFIKNIDLQIWNDDEYYTFDNRNIPFFNPFEKRIEILVGELNGSGSYNIYISSDYGVNSTFSIGVGIGREGKYEPLGRNIRNFY
ncbi:MAG: hypothetical protein JXR64_11560 [Spirochaetales bacterium]|nr:hypothetical protein [Spirochaetales bacterium]